MMTRWLRDPLVAVLLGGAVLSPARAGAAAVAVELKPVPGQTMVGRGFYLQASANNSGGANLNGVSYSLVIESLGGQVIPGATSGGIMNPLTAGSVSSVTYSFAAMKAGRVRFTFMLSGTEAGSGAKVQVSSAPVVVEIGDESANRPASGTFQIRHNILRVKKNDWNPVREMMYLVVTGPPGGAVSFSVHGPSGLRIDGVEHMVPANSGPGTIIKEWTIGADGRLTVPFDGVARQQLLESGPYWVVVAGAVTGKRPFVVIKE